MFSEIHAGLGALLILALIHLFASIAKFPGRWHERFLSFAAGLSFAYVFIDLLPTLEQGQPILRKTFEQVIPYFDRHTYVIALLGVLFYYGLHTSSPSAKRNFWLSMGGYLLFNVIVGASLSDDNNPDIKPLSLFTIAMGMHYFVSDHNACAENPDLYQSQARWLLVLSLFLGYFMGDWINISQAVIVILVSFLAGGMVLNALRYELPKREQVGYLFFVSGALIYSTIILKIGS